MVQYISYYFSCERNCMTLKMKTSDHYSMGNTTLIHADLLSMDVSWIPKDLELFENEFDFVVSMVCTIARFITFVMAIIVHRAFYRLMKRLPGREINQVIYPYMVKSVYKRMSLYKCPLYDHSWPFLCHMCVYLSQN